MPYRIQLLAVVLALVLPVPGAAHEHVPPARSLSPESGADAVMDAMGSILGYYHGARVTTQFCMSRFLDMRSDLEHTLVKWTRRNRPVAVSARRVVLQRKLVASAEALDADLQSHLSNYLNLIGQYDRTRQKTHCFDTMAMMDDASNDIRHRYQREYELLQDLLAPAVALVTLPAVDSADWSARQRMQKVLVETSG